MSRFSQATETRCSVAVFRGDALLLVRSVENGSEVWKLPGGHVWAEEGLIACARRELREETGLTADAMHCAFVLDVHDQVTGRYLVEIILIPSELLTGEPRRCEEGREPMFVAMDDLSRLALRPPETAHLYGLRALHKREFAEAEAEAAAQAEAGERAPAGPGARWVGVRTVR
ncbi:NUDIX hydrolase [Streptomyces sp. AK02-01A]|uniref:NUDIX hydrolase n=1 Tax=Streptomyces sp. AK02-01A TaxID=3028648 RepID=UPI0029AF2806|nr:NUDIX hydrolase [Streptomyces sp. AK02-01A]MDX3855479.1 NUDIX hydrolase [Streptomyces sp. AK02-01A]